MSKNAAQIRTAIRNLATRDYEIIAGTMVNGSLNTGACTIAVSIADELEPIHNVRLNAVTDSAEGLIVYPKDGSEVIIASIDGPGEWVLLRASAIDKAVVTIGDVHLEVSAAAIKLSNHSVALDIGDTVFKMNTAGESMHTFLKDLLTHVKAITVPTSTGPSGVPINLSDFVLLETRLDNLLGA